MSVTLTVEGPAADDDDDVWLGGGDVDAFTASGFEELAVAFADEGAAASRPASEAAFFVEDEALLEGDEDAGASTGDDWLVLGLLPLFESLGRLI